MSSEVDCTLYGLQEGVLSMFKMAAVAIPLSEYLARVKKVSWYRSMSVRVAIPLMATTGALWYSGEHELIRCSNLQTYNRHMQMIHDYEARKAAGKQ